jgi:hypothetical protein
MSRQRLALLGIMAAALIAAGALAQDAPPLIDETAKEVVAATVRSQGHPCDQPERAVHDTAASAPDQAVWLLDCTDARYRVRYDNDEPAEITRLD